MYFNELWLGAPQLHQPCAVLHGNIQSLAAAYPQGVAKCCVKVVRNVPAEQ